MFPLTEAMFSVHLHLFIPPTTVLHTHLLHGSFMTSLEFGRFFTATLLDVRPVIEINPLGKLIVEVL